MFISDLALMSDVRKLAAEMLDRYAHVDVLVNNVGIQLPGQRTTSEGLPEMVAVNYLAPWLLTWLLHDRLVASAPARVVVTASEAHRIGWRIDLETIFTDTVPFGLVGVLRAYGKSKLLDVLFTLELAARLNGTSVTANCCWPGLVATGLAGTDNVADRVATALSRTPLVLGTSARTRCAGPRPPGDRPGVRDPHRRVHLIDPPRQSVTEDPRRSGDAALRRQLWEATEALLNAT